MTAMVVPPVCEKARRDDADAAVVAKVGGEPCGGIRCEPSIPHAIVPLRGSAEVCRQMKYRGRRAAIQPAPGDPTCVHKAAKPCFIPVCARSRSSFEHFFPDRLYFGGIFGKKCSKVASAVRGRRQTQPLGLSVCVCCVNCHDLVCLRRRRSVIFSLADFACKQSVNTYIAGWSSLVARRAHNPKVVGSNPAPATKITSSLRRAFLLHLCRY